MATVQQLLRADSGLDADSARRDIEVLLSHTLDKPRAWLYTWPEKEVDPAHLQRFEQLLAQRQQGVPVAYLTGQRDFWSLSLTVTEATLIPRPETETLVEWALELALPQQASVLDLGTGCGAIALAVARERPQWQVSAVDASAAALQVASGNGVATGLTQVGFELSDWYEGLAGKRYDLLLSNPPYIDSNDAHLAQGDLRFEPRGALVAEQNGLADLSRLIEGATSHLQANGWLLLEHGYEQGAAVRQLMIDAGLSAVGTRRDLAGHERVTGGCWRAE